MMTQGFLFFVFASIPDMYLRASLMTPNSIADPSFPNVL